ncbi:ribosome-associated translation inhibitor RaiA, partial [Actinomadura darangshiensis]
LPPTPAENAARLAEDEAEVVTVSPDENLVPIAMDGDGPLVVREKFHKAEPMGIEQALFEMELVGHDFFLYRDKASGHPSVVYRRRGWDYGVIRLVEE